MSYTILHPDLHTVADSAKGRLNQKYGITISNFEKPLNSSLDYVPTFFGKTKFHYVVCEVASRPFPIHLKSIYADIQNQALPVKLFIAYNNTEMSSSEINKDIALAKKFGIGLLHVDDNNSVSIVSEPVSIPLFIPESVMDFKNIDKKFTHKIEEAYSVYLNGNPRQAVQAIGQIVERVIRDVAIQKYGTAPYTSGPDPNLEASSFGNIVNEMIKYSILKDTYLNRVRGFTDDRNSTSHIAKNLTQQLELEKKYKLLFETGLRLLIEVPKLIKDKGLKLKKID